MTSQAQMDALQAQLEAELFGDEHHDDCDKTAQLDSHWSLEELEQDLPLPTFEFDALEQQATGELDEDNADKPETLEADIEELGDEADIRAKYTIGGSLDLSDLLGTQDDLEDDQSDSQDEYEATYQDGLRSRANFTQKRKRKSNRASVAYSKPEIAALLATAHELCAERQYPQAVDICKEIIRLEPLNAKAYNLYALMCENRGDHDKAFRLYMIAAHLTPNDAGAWHTVVELSKKVGTDRETFYCLKKQMVAEPLNMNLAWQCCQLHLSCGEVKQAAKCLKFTLKHNPYNMIVVRELVNLYDELGDAATATQTLYDAVIGHANGLFRSPWAPTPSEDHSEVENSDAEGDATSDTAQLDLTMPKPTTMGELLYDDLYLLGDHCISVRMYRELLDGLKKGLRKMQGREHDTSWDAADNDDEYDPACVTDLRFLPNEFEDSGAGVPVELRVMLGIARMHCGDIALAQRHFNFLFVCYETCNMPEYSDLMDMVAETFMEFSMWPDAIQVLDIRLGIPYGEVANAYIMKGKCLAQVDRQTEAVACFEKAVEVDPDNGNAREQLAELHKAAGEYDKAFEVLSMAERAAETTEYDDLLFAPIRNGRRKGKAKKGAAVRRGLERPAIGSADDNESDSEYAPDELPDDDDDDGMIQTVRRSKSQRERLAERSVRLEAMEVKKREVKIKFDKVQLVWSRYDKLSPEQQLDFARTAESLYYIFTSTLAFYPQNNNSAFTGVSTTGRLQSARLDRVGDLEKEERDWVKRKELLPSSFKSNQDELEGLNSAERKIIRAREYLGYSFNDWFDVMTWYCVTLVKMRRPDEAHEAIKVIADANVIRHDEAKLNHLYLVGIALSLVLAFGHANNVRFFRRHILSNFGKILNPHGRAPGAAQAAAAEDGMAVDGSDKDGVDDSAVIAKAVILLTFGHMMTLARSFTSALAYYTRAYALAPNDRMVNFALGSAYVHRVMQRNTNNRHHQVAQALTFLYRYYELSGGDESQEANFNLGRAFHGIGLTAFARKHYLRVLELSKLNESSIDPMHDLCREAAYNLAHIYIQSGSGHLAQRVLYEFCAV
ncbi:transcription factor TFIIIC subunit tfc4 [Sorochytrium milnesiophthora]